MLINQALEVLALRPGATPSEIKEAYRDLVKVWHPDRFGDDQRLREKAELQLKLINQAYNFLQSNPTVCGVYTPNSQSASPRYHSSSRAAHGRRHSAPPFWKDSRYWPNISSARGRWIYGGLAALVIFLAVFLIIEHDPMQNSGPSRALIQQPAIAAATSDQPTQQSSPDGQAIHSQLNVAKARPSAVSPTNDSAPAGFKVRSLSETQTDRLNALCSQERESWGEAAYQSCLKAQLAMMTNPAGKPDLSALHEPERESIESACSDAKNHGPDSYNRCETAQVASLAAEPARPDLSKLSSADRDALELACTDAKDQEGPAAYHRCLAKFMKALAEAK